MSVDMNGGRGHTPAAGAEEPVDVRRYVGALRRSRWLIVAIVVATTALVVLTSLALSKTYQATASIVVDPSTNALGSTDATTVERELATMQTLATTNDVLAQAARAVPGETAGSLKSAVTVTVDQNANVIDVTVNHGTAGGAQKLADAVAQAFLMRQASVERTRITRAQAALNDQIAALRGQGAAGGDTASQIQALQARLAELSVAEASTGSDVQLTQQAERPSSPSSPKPMRNGVLAFFASIFIALLVALARDQVSPRIGSERELGHLLGLPVLSGIPYKRRRARTRTARAEYETYQTLSAAVRLALPPDRQHVILVTSAVHAEGKTTVAQRLARLLAQAGHETLVVSGDLRWPKLDAACDVARDLGIRELLADAADTGTLSPGAVTGAIVPVDRYARGGELDILPAGRNAEDVSTLLTPDALELLFDALRQLRYTYVLVDAPPLLGVADTRVIAQFCDELLLVARLDRLTMANAIDLREMLDRVKPNPIGTVVIGARLPDSPYYWTNQPVAPSPA